MYGLKKNIDLSFLIGREVIQVAIGMFQVQFHFDKEATISVESEFEYVSNGNPSRWSPGAPAAAAPALRLMGSAIQDVKGAEDGTHSVTFLNGDRLIVKDNKQYESYTICGGPGGVIVV